MFDKDGNFTWTGFFMIIAFAIIVCLGLWGLVSLNTIANNWHDGKQIQTSTDTVRVIISDSTMLDMGIDCGDSGLRMWFRYDTISGQRRHNITNKTELAIIEMIRKHGKIAGHNLIDWMENQGVSVKSNTIYRIAELIDKGVIFRKYMKHPNLDHKFWYYYLED